MTTSRNCRFRAHFNGCSVIITIRPGQTLSHGQFYRHEEGWTSQSTVYSLSDDGTELTRECTDDGTDCDGRLTRYYDCQADAYRLDNSRWPHWIDLKSSQRDQFAELANY